MYIYTQPRTGKFSLEHPVVVCSFGMMTSDRHDRPHQLPGVRIRCHELVRSIILFSREVLTQVYDNGV
jgi:hypothetical protein